MRNSLAVLPGEDKQLASEVLCSARRGNSVHYRDATALSLYQRSTTGNCIPPSSHNGARNDNNSPSLLPQWDKSKSRPPNSVYSRCPIYRDAHSQYTSSRYPVDLPDHGKQILRLPMALQVFQLEERNI
uniref:Uncharacterized protein n=1 Tax=Cacopsylla melanoneura TaxID=428564 RepID=A0A8D9B169_9HEMI